MIANLKEYDFFIVVIIITMGGGLMDLVAYGAQDIYLTGNPQITFFKVVYRRHTNFSMETIQQTIQGSGTLDSNSETSGTVNISRNGDLLSDVYLSTPTSGTAGDKIVKIVDLEIGGQLIDRQTAEWMQIWTELTTPEEKQSGFAYMTKSHYENHDGLAIVPLQFWFCRNPGLALPLIALQYHEVKLKFTFNDGTFVGADSVLSVWADYIYLDTDERRRFAQVSHEYLIEQVQYAEVPYQHSAEVKLRFNHPVKEIIWTSNYIGNTYTKARIELNGHDRFEAQEEEYFQLRHPYKYHTNIPSQNLHGVNIGMASANADILGGNASTKVAPTTVSFATAATAIPADSMVVSRIRSGAVQNGSFDGPTVTNDVVLSATSAAELGASDLVYSFHGIHPFQTHTPVGTLLAIEVTGTESVANGSTIRRIYTRVTAVSEHHLPDNLAADGGGTINGTQLQFDESLCEGTLGAEITANANFQILNISLVADVTASTSTMVDRINVYSFALKPEEHQPSGTCNFSRIDSAKLIFDVRNAMPYTIYAHNYNVLRIMSGMGGLAYSN